MVLHPRLCPAVSEVDDEDKLNDDEQESSHHSEVHPGWAKTAVWDKEGSDAAGDYDEIFDAPEPVLDTSPGVARIPNPDHQHRHEEEEQSDNEADPAGKCEQISV